MQPNSKTGEFQIFVRRNSHSAILNLQKATLNEKTEDALLLIQKLKYIDQES